MSLFSRKVVIPDELVKFNTFSPEKEKVLCIGAAATECKHKIETKLDGSNRYLKLYYPKNRANKVKKYWLSMFDITDSHSAQSIIEQWIKGNDYTNKVADDVKKTVLKEINRSNKIDGDVTGLVAAAQSVQTYGAFDLERLGYLVRVCYSLDFLTEEQAWDYLKELYELVVEHFSNWDDYMISYKNGEEGLDTSWYSDALKSYIALKNDSESLYNRYPLK